MQLAASAEGLQGRFRVVELELPADAALPEPAPARWLEPQRAGRLVRFVHSQFSDETLAAELAEHLPQARPVEVRPMSLREIFVALARTYRLTGAAEPLASRAQASGLRGSAS